VRKALADHQDHVDDLLRQVTHRSNRIRVQKAETDLQRCSEYLKKYSSVSQSQAAAAALAASESAQLKESTDKKLTLTQLLGKK
jgi:hypothetical protein